MRNSVDLTHVKDIHWRVQDSTSESLLFYKINDDQKSEELFRSRIRDAKFKVLIVNRQLSPLPENTVVVPEADWPETQTEVLDKLYPLPKMKLIALTGTNGKTTTTDLVLQLGHHLGKRGMSIGTLGVREFGKTLVDFGLTSPPLIDLRKYLTTFGHDKDFCVLEASSHALLQERIFGLEFDAAGWLSFSQDHLDYHKTMDEYFSAKCLLFEKLRAGAQLYVPHEQQKLYARLKSVSGKAIFAREISTPLPLFFRTQFNRNNLEVAASIVESVFGEIDQSIFEKLAPPDGRFYIQAYKSNYIVVDFAHSPDALENICRGIKDTFPGFGLKVLFGCGGDRDRSKRPLMAEVVDQWADEIYVTSDNPRSENPEQIIQDILTGIKKTKVQIITERPKAVKTAFSELREKEVLLLAGKGHEDYILVNGVKHPYSDIREVDEFIARNKNDKSKTP